MILQSRDRTEVEMSVLLLSRGCYFRAGYYLSEEKPGLPERIMSQDCLRSRGKSLSYCCLGNFKNNADDCFRCNMITGDTKSIDLVQIREGALLLWSHFIHENV